VQDIFDEPKFFIEGATANDVRQGKEGDCWFMAALCTLSNKEGLIQKVCVARDEQVGVYGFVFHRDGSWYSEVIDDKLYLIKEDFHESLLERNKWLELQNRQSPEEEYRAVMQTGSRALYFAQCSDPNETWLPLLEKAYAKAHGDYGALDSGFVGEGIEDLTGGVTTELFSTDILDKDKFWKEELMQVNKQFLFGCGQMGGKDGQRQGILKNHAYSIMEAREVNGQRLLKLRNPWGNTEWRGPWSDGSAEWTPEWMRTLDHTFGDDGLFWISYRDLLRNYQHLDRTRLFGPEWTVTHSWTSVNVPWSVDYLDTKFKIVLEKASPVVIVLSQLDDRFFRGLEGQYEFTLQFRLHKEGDDEYIVRSNVGYYMNRSVSTELDLDPGTYYVLLKITAKRYSTDETPEDVIRRTCYTRREKLLSIGLSYDLAHAKGQFRELEREKLEREKGERFELRKANARKAFEARRKQRKKTKLRNINKDRKIAQRLEEFERRKQEQKPNGIGVEQTQWTSNEAADVEKRLGDFTLEPASTTTAANGLGIKMNGEGDNGSNDSNGKEGRSSTLPTPAPTPVSPAFNRISNDVTRPPTPPQRTTSPQPIGGGATAAMSRRDTLRSGTLPIGRPRRETLSPNLNPAIMLHRPSLTHAHASAADGDHLSLSDISDEEPDWDSEIDGPDSSEDEECYAGAGARPSSGRSLLGFASDGLQDGGGGGDGDADEEGEDEVRRDPWNAVVVLGLRVFCLEGEGEIKVVRAGSGGRDDGLGVGKGLDVDDASRDAARGVSSSAVLDGYAVGAGVQNVEVDRQG